MTEKKTAQTGKKTAPVLTLEQRLESSQVALQNIVNNIAAGKHQLAQLEHQSVELQGQIKLLDAMIKEKQGEKKD